MVEPIAVVGASGFLGRHLVVALRDAGAAVLPFRRSRPPIRDGVLADGMSAAPVIFYLATSVNLGIAERHPERVTADYEAFTGMLAALRREDTRPTVVFASSGTCYDTRATAPYAEDARTHSETTYGRLKIRMEQALMDHSDAVIPVVLRLASMYGPGHHTEPGHGVIAHWLTALASGRPIQLIGDLDVRRDFVYVGDVAEAFLRVSAAVTAGERLPPVINIGSGMPTTLAELLGTVSEVTGRTPEMIRQTAREYDRRELWLDVGLARQVLGWRALTSLTDGLPRTWQAVLAETASMPS